MGGNPNVQVLSSQASLKRDLKTSWLGYDSPGLFQLCASTIDHSWEKFLIDVPDNASTTLGEVEIRPSPNLWLAVFDPSSGLEQALDSGYSSLNPVDANGMSSVNLDINLRQSLDATQLFYYSAENDIMYRV